MKCRNCGSKLGLNDNYCPVCLKKNDISEKDSEIKKNEATESKSKFTIILYLLLFVAIFSFIISLFFNNTYVSIYLGLIYKIIFVIVILKNIYHVILGLLNHEKVFSYVAETILFIIGVPCLLYLLSLIYIIFQTIFKQF